MKLLGLSRYCSTLGRPEDARGRLETASGLIDRGLYHDLACRHCCERGESVTSPEKKIAFKVEFSRILELFADEIYQSSARFVT